MKGREHRVKVTGSSRRKQMERQAQIVVRQTPGENLLAAEFLVGAGLIIGGLFAGMKLGDYSWAAWVVVVVLLIGMDVGRRFLVQRGKARANSKS